MPLPGLPEALARSRICHPCGGAVLAASLGDLVDQLVLLTPVPLGLPGAAFLTPGRLP